MAISESQLDIWSKIGATSQSQATYATVRRTLEQTDAPYANKSFDIFLQGSYANDTNIYADSDVDVIIRVDDVYYADTTGLGEADLAAYSSGFSKASYQYQDFKREVISHLAKRFGSAVVPGKKAIFVEGDGNRRDADVLPAAQFRKYTRYRSSYDCSYVEGVCFWTTDNVRLSITQSSILLTAPQNIRPQGVGLSRQCVS